MDGAYCELSRHEFCLNGLTFKTSGRSTAMRTREYLFGRHSSGSNRARQPVGVVGAMQLMGLVLLLVLEGPEDC
jgi:hypothetical protein